MTYAMTWAMLSVAIAAEVAGTTLLHMSRQFTRPLPAAGSLMLYALAFYLLSHVMRTLPVGVVYAVWSGLGIVFITAVGWLAFRQTLDWPVLLGIAMILGGVVLVNLHTGGAGH
ncbi:Membrane transporter [Rubellimicrobium thermophilum DSM 16684]|uniref:Membrane transporter n=1 Tax=Rubellimicrobium thermophilum DSM 16684 TaxID=1123069 RepID=S9R3K7_9RHOB|nr:multidrug efflux SMR transporter [Rubellimicrobium thermophilum]EPX86558.1 Membrane transporter [Rubellimicrobium thermophilum DSM 16684]